MSSNMLTLTGSGPVRLDFTDGSSHTYELNDPVFQAAWMGTKSERDREAADIELVDFATLTFPDNFAAIVDGESVSPIVVAECFELFLRQTLQAELARSSQPVDFEARIRGLIADVELDPTFSILLIQDQLHSPGRWFLQLEKTGTDAITGGRWQGRGERLFLSEVMTDGEIINSLFDLYRLFWEHEARESFRWKNRRIYSPHRSLQGLWEGARKLDIRPNEDNGLN